MYRLVLVLVIILQCNFLWAIKPLPEGIEIETGPVEEEVVEAELKEGPPPLQIQEAIEIEEKDRQDVIQKRNEELKRQKELVKKPKFLEPIPAPKPTIKGPSIGIIITTLLIFLIAFFIYRRK